ncbi:NADP-dependent oxidoreductase [Actinophytocola sp.]|jgi:NADPH:quinone reductase-like Zn-dependent oxidoreductase|uniref:NADP-dependent oxidoreductase n=1 Tax=Actinophytocola sp. TaxID=1872138 RepID=UPI002EDB9B8A
MSRAVRFERYGGIDVLDVVDVDPPEPGPGEVLVEVRAAGINPGEAAIREGKLHERWPATFPSGQGSDLAGVVVAGDSFAAGDEVLGFTDARASQAEHVVVPATQLVRKPAGVPWEQAGALKVAGTTAYAGVEAVGVREGEVVVVSGAAGGVGSLTVQLAHARGAAVIGLAGEEHHDWLAAHGVVPLDYRRPELADRIRAASGRVDAFLDTYGGGYVELATELGVDPSRINTIADFAAAKEHGTRAVGGAEASTAPVLATLAEWIAVGELEVPIARTYPLDQVREAYAELERRHTLGKIVLVP